MKKRYEKANSSKLNIILVIAALLALVVSVVTVSYSWIESSNSIAVNNGGSNTISVKTDNPGVAQITAGDGEAVKLSQYIDNAGSLFLAPAKLDGTTLKIKRASGNYEAATKNDIGNNYIEFDVPFTVPARYKFSFTDESKITVDGNASNPIRTSLKVDDREAIVFDSSLNKVGTSDKSAFSVKAGQHTLKVRIWLDASTTENATAAESIKGKTVDISLNLVPEIDASLRKVTISKAAHADVTATYNNGTSDVTLNEGDSATLEPGTELTVTVKTADGIVTGSNSALNGYMFKNISTDVAGSSTVLTSTVGSTNTSTHIATTTYTYTVPDDGNTADIFINTNTDRENFYIIGPGIKENSNWSEPKNTTLDNYDPINNCVYGVFTANDTGGIFKISEKTDGNPDGGGRDSTLYSVSLNSPTVIKSGNITSAGLDNGTGVNKCLTYTTSSSGEKILVIYYLDDNEVEIASGSTYVAQYTATAKVSTTNSNGTATVTYGDTTASTVSVPRRAADKNVTFKATPSSSNYKFVGWSTTDDGTSYVSTDAEYKTAITGDWTLYANFKRVHTLTVTPADMIKADGVKFEINQSTNKGRASIVEGTDVNLTASSPNSSNTYKVVWLDGGSPVNTDVIGPEQSQQISSYTISNMSAAHDIIVQYIQLYTLTVQKTGDGASDSNATVSAVVKDEENNTYELSNGVAYVPANTTAVVTANVAAGGNPYRVSSNGVAGKINGKQDLIPASTAAAAYTFSPETINANTTISIDFTRLYKLTYSLVDSVTGAAIAAQATESGSTSKAITSPAYMPENTVVEFTVTPSGDDYIHAYSLNGGTTYTIGTLPSQTVTADTDIKVKVVNSRNVTINVPDPTVATLTATYTFPGVTGSETLTIAATAGPQSFKLPQGATITVTANILDSKDKFTDFTVTGSTEVTQDADNKSVAVVVQGENITITPNIAIMAVAECAQDIVNGAKVSFYAGTRFSNNTNEVIVAENDTWATTTPVKKAPDYTNVTIDGKTYNNVINVIEVASQVYYIKHNTEWAGVETSEAVKGGKFYGVYSEAYESNTPTSYGPTTATTTLSASEVELNATGVTVTTGGFTDTTTAVGTQYYVQHFIKKSTDSQYMFLATSPKITATTDEFVTDISDYAKSAGTYEIKTVLTDGKVYYVVDTDNITVVEKFNVTVESTSNANLVVKNGSTTLGTINAGASAQTFRVVKGDSITVTATPTDNTGVYDFQWTSTGKTISKETYKATSSYTETINNDTTIGVTVDNHCYKLTYSGVTATPASDSYVSAGTNVTLTFKDTTNHNKVVWSVNGTEVKTTNVVEKGSEDTYIVTMDADKTVTVSKTTLYKLTYSIAGADSSTLTSNLSTDSADTATVGGSTVTKYVTNNTAVTFTVTKPDADNYYTVSWETTDSTGSGYKDGGHVKSQTETNNYTITSDTTVEVTVTKSDTYAVTIKKPTNATFTTVSYKVGSADIVNITTDVNNADTTVNLPEGSVVTVEATANTNYQFESFTVNTDTVTDNPATVTVGTETVTISVNVTESASRIIYFNNTNGWSSVYAYAWQKDTSNKNNAWPGVVMDNVSGDIWSITLENSDWNMIIFNQNVSGNANQTADLQIPEDGKNLFTITGSATDSKLTGTWSVYDPYGGVTLTEATVPTFNTASNMLVFNTTTAIKSIWYWESGSGTVKNTTVKGTYNSRTVSTFSTTYSAPNAIGFSTTGTENSTNWPGDNNKKTGDITKDSGISTYPDGVYYFDTLTDTKWKTFTHLSSNGLSSADHSESSNHIVFTFDSSSISGTLSAGATYTYYATDGTTTYKVDSTDSSFTWKKQTGSWTFYAVVKDPYGLETVKSNEVQITVS